MNEDWRVVDAATGRTLVERLSVADTFWRRLVGWQFRSAPPAGSGLLLAPCKSIHTMFVRFAIDAVFLDRRGTVLAVRRAVRPWRLVSPVRRAHATLELPAGTAAVEPGQTLRIVPPGGTFPLGKHLRDLVGSHVASN